MLQQEERAPENIYFYLDHSAIWPPENMTEAKSKILVKKEIRKYFQSFTTLLNKSKKRKNLNKTGLDPVSRPVEQILEIFAKCFKKLPRRRCYHKNKS